MARSLVFYGNETLRRVAQEVANIDQKVINLIESMFNIMYRGSGIGLAAPQVDVSKRIIVIDLESYKGPVIALINPVITAASDTTGPYEEGCLSVPGVTANIVRPVEISVKATDPEGKEFTLDADGLLARVIQHEYDHLNGILIVDHMKEDAKREVAPELKRIKKLNRKP